MKKEENPVNPGKVKSARVSMQRAILKVVRHFNLNPMEMVYAHHEALASVSNMNDPVWKAFVAGAFVEVFNPIPEDEPVATH